MQEHTPVEKAYCCGNSAQREAKLISKFDLVVACAGLVVVSVVFSVVVANPRAFGDFGNTTNSENATVVSTIIQMSRGGQVATIILTIIWHIIEVVLAFLLLIGAVKRHHKSLLIWFASTIGACCIKITSYLVAIFNLNEKITLSISLVVSFLYNWYCLWIVKILMREITSVGEREEDGDAYAHPIDDDIELGTAEGGNGIPMKKF